MRLAKLTSMVLVGAAPLLAQTAHPHHPPRSTEEYIKALEDPARDEWQQPQRVMESLELKPGLAIADLGAGSGYFTLPLARATGPTGKVYAVDIDSNLLEHIARRAKEERLSNIQTVLAKPDDPKLEPSSIDLILISDTLHHIENRGAYYPLLARALKPGGRLVNIDFEKRQLPVGPPVAMKIAKRDMVQEAEVAGFHLVKEFKFLNYQYFLVFAR
jgi:ubiquinone/menaquinone biosynthesis C-methylase UbiE